MKRILHIIATPREHESRTLLVARHACELIKKSFPSCLIDECNVSREPLPPLTARTIEGKFMLLSGKDLPQESMPLWKDIITHAERFASQDAYIISTPMWNFSIPYYLKHYIDVVVQPRYAFHYTDKGPVGHFQGKKMLVITSRGGDYGPASPVHAYDQQEPYLRTVFGFTGITAIDFVHAQPMDAAGADVRAERIEAAKQQVARILATW